MSDESVTSPDSPEKIPASVTVSRAKRISNPRPKKQAKTVVAEKKVSGDPVEPVPVAPIAPVAPTVIPSTSVEKTTSEPSFVPSSSAGKSEPSSHQSDADWPEPEPAHSGGSTQDSAKRKRRRRKGKGQAGGGQHSVPQAESDFPAVSSIEQKSVESRAGESRPPQSQPAQGNGSVPQPRPKWDSEHLAKLAWKIYLAEVSEEGVALIGDNDAKDLSRRCFRLAEIFMEEQVRRR